MSNLFTRTGKTVTPNGQDAKGRPLYIAHRPCLRCGGQGGAEAWRHTGWTCYRCGGDGRDPGGPFSERVYTADQLEVLNARLAKSRAKRAAKQADKARAERDARQAAWEAYYTPRHTVIDQILAHRDVHEFLRSVARDIEAAKQPSENAFGACVSILINHFEREDARRSSQFVGAVGERREFAIRIEKIIDCSYGSFPRIYSYLHLCRDDAGNRIVYKGSACIGDEGETVKVKATVKGHDVYNGEKQTFIQRPKAI